MYKRVIVPLDGSALAETIIPFLVEIAGPLDMSIVLLRVVEPIPPSVVGGPAHGMFQNIEVRLRDASEYLAPLAVGLRARGIEVECLVRHGQRVSDRILAVALETGADLIAMTTHGRSGLGRLLFGSVAESVLREAQIPVFLLRQTEAQLARHRTVKEAVR